MTNGDSPERTVLVTMTKRRGDRLRLVFAVVTVGLILFAQLFVLKHRDWGMPWEWEVAELAELFSRITDSMQTNIAVSLMLAATPIAAWVMYRALNQRMIVSPTGINFSTRLPGLLKRIQPDWSWRWNEIDSISPGRRHPHAPGTPVSLIFRSGKMKREVSLILGWHEEGKGNAKRKGKAFYLSIRNYLQDAIRENVLLLALERFGVDLGLDKPLPPRDDALIKHPAGIAFAILTITAFGYGVVELVILPETYAGEYPWFEIGGLALLGGGVGMLGADKMQLPKQEKLLLPLLFGVALGFAAYPGLLRVNMMTDDSGLHMERFRQAEDFRLVPLNPELPVIRAARYDRYWRTFETGAVHEIPIRKGGLGFYQYDQSGIREAIRQRQD